MYGARVGPQCTELASVQQVAMTPLHLSCAKPLLKLVCFLTDKY